MDGLILADSAHYEEKRRLEDAERHHRRTQHSEKQRAKSKGRAQAFAEGKAEGMQQAMKELVLWDSGFQEDGRAPSAGTTVNNGRHRSETLRIEFSTSLASHSQREMPHRGSSIFSTRGFFERRSIAMRVDSRADDRSTLRASSPRPPHHSRYVVFSISHSPFIQS